VVDHCYFYCLISDYGTIAHCGEDVLDYEECEGAPTVLVRAAVLTQASGPGLYLAGRPCGPGG
jgi:hypothetical protein